MVLLTLLASAFGGPVIYAAGRRSGNALTRRVGTVLWISGWAYLGYVAHGLMSWK